ncbi:hypothetical protein XM47_14140 [Catenovulum maritimum]|uniref:Uncharacterized protein n=1 Tax=Catenovulum maritimum TaxID=1513271 RepID=A0A0J8GT18_9ALTE|nr:hypothetical protein XM47_14140 [Catenovulum maritimum]
MDYYSHQYFESSFGCKPTCFEEQEQVTVLYRDGNAKDPRISDFMSLWLPSLLLLGIGTSFIVVSFFQIKRLRGSIEMN